MRLETVASVEGRPANVVFQPSDRDIAWQKLYDQHKGKIDADFGKLAFTTPPLAAYPLAGRQVHHDRPGQGAEDAGLCSGRRWAGPGSRPSRSAKVPGDQAAGQQPVDHPARRRPPEGKPLPLALDLHDPETGKRATAVRKASPDMTTVAAWHGTLLPKASGDIWLATAFAAYEPIAALDNALRKQGGGKLTPADQDKIAVQLFAYKVDYSLGSRTSRESSLSGTTADMRHDDWYRVASGKGVLLLHELRCQLGAETFDAMMDEFGRENAGKSVTTAQFVEHVEKAAGKPLKDFFKPWLEETGLPGKSGGTGKEAGGPFSVLTFAKLRRRR